MAKADVLQLVTDLGVTTVDQTEIGIFYDEVVRELGFNEILTGTELVPVKAGNPEYILVEDTMRALEFHANGGRLDPIDITSLQSVFGVGWRTRTGTPLGYTQEEENEKTFRLVPSPTQDDTITVIRTEARTDVPVWLELPIALDVLGREYQRESDHQDVAFAQIARQLSLLLFKLVGVSNNAART